MLMCGLQILHSKIVNVFIHFQVFVNSGLILTSFQQQLQLQAFAQILSQLLLHQIQMHLLCSVAP